MVLKRRRENIAKLNISYFRSRNVSPLFRCNSSVSNVTSSQMSEKENTTDPILQIYWITKLLGFLNSQENTTNLIVKNFICFVLFLSDPSPIIGYACHSLTHSLTDSCLVNLIDVTLACEDANSKLAEVVTVADVDAEDRVGNSLSQIWDPTFGPKAKLLFRL